MNLGGQSRIVCLKLQVPCQWVQHGDLLGSYSVVTVMNICVFWEYVSLNTEGCTGWVSWFVEVINTGVRWSVTTWWQWSVCESRVL